MCIRDRPGTDRAGPPQLAPRRQGAEGVRLPPDLVAAADHDRRCLVNGHGGRRELGESDRLVDFYTLEFGKLRGVAKAARRVRSRFGSALELFTLGAVSY